MIWHVLGMCLQTYSWQLPKLSWCVCTTWTAVLLHVATFLFQCFPTPLCDPRSLTESKIKQIESSTGASLSLSLSLSVSLPSKKPTFLANSRKQKQSWSLGLFQNQTEIHRTSESCSTHWSTCSFSQLLPSQFTQVQESHRKQHSLHFTPSLVKPKC